jgi:ribosomal protein S18 acetylase RimI-like enzyme
MYAEYLKEREGKDILQHEHGFAIYGFNCVPGVDFPHCYLQDIWTAPALRKSGVARSMADKIAQMAKDKGIRIMFGSVDGNAKGAHASLQVLIAYGMKLYSINDSTAWFFKEL